MEWEIPDKNPREKNSSKKNSMTTKEMRDTPMELKSQLEHAATWIIAMGVIYVLISLVQFIGGNSEGIGVGIFYLFVSLIYFAGSSRVRIFAPSSKGWLIAFGVTTLPLAFGIIPIFAIVTFFQTVGKIRQFEKFGSDTFMTNEEYKKSIKLKTQTSKKNNRIALIVLSVLLALFLLIIIVALLNRTDQPLTSNSSELNTTSVATPAAEVQPGDIFNEINNRRVNQGVAQLEYSAVAQNVAQNLAYFNYQNPSVPVSSTVLTETYGGQNFSPYQAAYTSINDMSCTSTASTIVDRFYASDKNSVNSYLYTEAGVYIGKNDAGLCNIWVALDHP